MSIELKSGNVTLTINEPNDFIELMDDEGKLELIESLACHEAVIRHVSDQIIYGFTESGNSGSKVHHWDADSGSELDKAKNRIAKHSCETAKARIVDLEKECQRLNDKYYELLRERSY